MWPRISCVPSFVFLWSIEVAKWIVRASRPKTASHSTSDNEFIGIGKGIGGDIEVKVTMDGDAIASVEVLSHNETPGISDKAISDIPNAIVEAQSPEVDAISGATLSSNGIMQAVKEAVGK